MFSRVLEFVELLVLRVFVGAFVIVSLIDRWFFRRH